MATDNNKVTTPPPEITTQQSYANYRGTGGSLPYADWWAIGRPFYYQPELEREPPVGGPPRPRLIPPKVAPEPEREEPPPVVEPPPEPEPPPEVEPEPEPPPKPIPVPTEEYEHLPAQEMYEIAQREEDPATKEMQIKQAELYAKEEGITLGEVKVAAITDLSQPGQFETYQTLTDREKFDVQVKLGKIPEGSEFVSGLKVEYAPEVPIEERILEPREWGYYTPEQVAEMAEYKATQVEIDAALAKLKPYKTDEGYELQRAFDEGKGADVYAAKALGIFTDEDIVAAQFGAIEARIEVRAVAKEVAKFEATHTELPDGQYIDNKQLAEIETTAPDIHKILLDDGFDVANKIIEERLSATKELEGYAVLDAPVGTGYPFSYLKEHYPIGYDLKRFVVEHPDTGEKTLLTAGFTQEQIDTALARVAIPTYEEALELAKESPYKIGAYEPPNDRPLAEKFYDSVISFFTGRGTGELAKESEFIKTSIPGFFAGMSEKQYQAQVEAESLYRYLFKEEHGRLPTYAEYPDIKAGLPRAISIASIVPGVVTAYRWDTMNTEQKWQAIMGDIAMAAMYGMIAIGVTLKPGKVPTVKYQVVDELGNLTKKTVKIPVYTPETAATKFAAKNPAWVKAGATPLKVYGEMGEIKPITPLLSPEPLLASLDWKTVPWYMKGGTRIPSRYIPPTFIPSSSYFPGVSYTTAKGVTIDIPAGILNTEGLIPSGMEIWSRAGIEQPWNPFTHTGARILATPVTGELTIIDTATGRTRHIGATGEISVGLAGTGAPAAAAPSTRTMTPEQLAKLVGELVPEPFIWYEETPEGLIIPKISYIPRVATVARPSVSGMVAPTVRSLVAPAPGVAIAPSPTVAISPMITPSVAISPAVSPAVAVAVAPAVTPIPAPVVISIPTPTPIPALAPVPLLFPKATYVDDATGIIKPGCVVWKQGLFWILIPPPYTKKYYTKKQPPGVTKVATGKGSAYKTIQVIGGLPDKDVDINVGWAIVKIRVKAKDVTIEFIRGPEAGKTEKEQWVKPERESRKRQGETVDEFFFGKKAKRKKVKRKEQSIDAFLFGVRK